MSDFPEDLKYSAEHEWVRSGNSTTVRIGITEYAADQLGDIVFVTLPQVGEAVSHGDACGEPDPRGHAFESEREEQIARNRRRDRVLELVDRRDEK